MATATRKGRNFTAAPVVIGGTGGSGTRVPAGILRDGGVFMGTRLNKALDALEFHSFQERWIPRCGYPNDAGDAGLPEREQVEMARAFRICVRRHRRDIPRPWMSWGLKFPRSIYLLPFFCTQFPELRFLHLVRDGRDMAYSANQRQLHTLGPLFLSAEQLGLAEPLRSAILWNRINVWAAEFGRGRLGDNYCCIRFEDLCARPLEAIGQIEQFLGIRLRAPGRLAGEVESPTTIGRWQGRPGAELDCIRELCEEGLGRFGYE